MRPVCAFVPTTLNNLWAKRAGVCETKQKSLNRHWHWISSFQNAVAHKRDPAHEIYTIRMGFQSKNQTRTDGSGKKEFYFETITSRSANKTDIVVNWRDCHIRKGKNEKQFLIHDTMSITNYLFRSSSQLYLLHLVFRYKFKSSFC